MSRSELEEAFWTGWLLHSPPEAGTPEREAKLIQGSKARVDFAWPDEKVFVSVEGGQWGPLVRCDRCRRYVTRKRKDGSRYRVREAGGRHYRGGGVESDARKYNALAAMGWVRIIVLSTMVQRSRIRETVEFVSGVVLGRQQVREPDG